ncbi:MULTISPECIES: cupin domain-containing protein [Mesotoga]|uniref:cupin domain-containing protein n=1 Tax=Mesotoga TaxID=1184396 RepID=UPI0002C99F7E|nr:MULTISPECIES: cupin domain-containing protein [Mesotoga]MCP5456852.1 cupin domain-containing protein [Thermotogota bacterium]CCU86052.1 Cupin 2 conserved barrel domain protein [Mesotoga infera]MCB1222442.1 cupin domain-containing protein [Mesotoga sp.]MCP5461029.1 cupin domain-containing protein [Thermotogota bacterium]HNQ70057.1 cupin domain-containing protein [Mesotoga prima]
MSERILVGKALDVEPQFFDNENVKSVTKRVLIGKKKGATNFVMRLFTVGEGGYSPHHSHPWEHEVFIISGEAAIVTDQGVINAGKGSYVFVPSGVKHQFRNTGNGDLEFLCVIPSSADEE